MASCSRDADCRKSEGYACVDVATVDPWSIEVVERGSASTKICMLPWSGPPYPPGSDDAVCGTGADASFPPPAVAPDATTAWPPVPIDDASVPQDGGAGGSAEASVADATSGADASLVVDAAPGDAAASSTDAAVPSDAATVPSDAAAVITDAADATPAADAAAAEGGA